MPFITEKLWLSLVNKETFLMSQNFNKVNFDQSFDNSKKYILKIIEILTSLRNLRADLNISYKHNTLNTIRRLNISRIARSV